MSETEEKSGETDSNAKLREALYDQFDISWIGELIIEYILPILDQGHETDSRYEINDRQKILAEIALCKAYRQEPKLKMLVWTGGLIGISTIFTHSIRRLTAFSSSRSLRSMGSYPHFARQQ